METQAFDMDAMCQLVQQGFQNNVAVEGTDLPVAAAAEPAVLSAEEKRQAAQASRSISAEFYLRSIERKLTYEPGNRFRL